MQKLKTFLHNFSKPYNIHVWKIIYSIWRKGSISNSRLYFTISRLVGQTPKLCRYEYSKIDHVRKQQTNLRLWFGCSLMQFSKSLRCALKSYTSELRWFGVKHYLVGWFCNYLKTNSRQKIFKSFWKYNILDDIYAT